MTLYGADVLVHDQGLTGCDQVPPTLQPLGPSGQPLGPPGQPVGSPGQPLGSPGQPVGSAGQPFADSGLLAAHAAQVDEARLRARDGALLPFAAARWHAPATLEEIAVLDHVVGPVLDVACGPGRLVRHLVDQGVVAVGVDVAPDAVAAAVGRGAPAVLGDLWETLPNEGGWETVLLFDGNIGIGAEPLALLGRCAELLAPGGGLLVEVGPAGSITERVEARIEWRSWRSAWFAWATVAAHDLPELAGAAGLRVAWVEELAGRCFARLQTPCSYQQTPFSYDGCFDVGCHPAAPPAPGLRASRRPGRRAA